MGDGQRWSAGSFLQAGCQGTVQNDELNLIIAVYHKEHAPDFMRSVDVRALYPHATEAEIIAHEAKYKGRSHLVYAMMVAETLAEHLTEMNSFTFCPDELNEGQRALDLILTYRLLLQQERKLALKRVERVAAMQRGLDFADMCAGAAFEAYQRGDSRYLDILRPYVLIKDLPNMARSGQSGTGA